MRLRDVRLTAAAVAAANANWDKAAEHAARCAPYLHHKLVAVERSPHRKLYIHHKLVAVERSQSRKLSEMSTEELEAAAEEAREELERLRDEDRALVQDAVTKSLH